MDRFKTTEAIQGIVDINTQTDMSVSGQTAEGKPFLIDSFRERLHIADEEPTSPDDVFASVRLGSTPDETADSFYARIPRRLEAAKEHTIEYVKAHNKKLVVVGSAVLTIAAGTGILVRRIRRVSK